MRVIFKCNLYVQILLELQILLSRYSDSTFVPKTAYHTFAYNIYKCNAISHNVHFDSD